MGTALSTIAGWRPVHQSSDIFGYGATCPHAFTMARIVWRVVVFCTHATPSAPRMQAVRTGAPACATCRAFYTRRPSQTTRLQRTFLRASSCRCWER